jgi:hypothetical protein
MTTEYYYYLPVEGEEHIHEKQWDMLLEVGQTLHYNKETYKVVEVRAEKEDDDTTCVFISCEPIGYYFSVQQVIRDQKLKELGI